MHTNPNLPQEPRREDFQDEEEFLEARDAWRHQVMPILALARSVESRRQREQSRSEDSSEK